MCDYKFHTDPQINRLHMRLEGQFSKSELRDMADQVIIALALLDPGFDIISDIRSFFCPKDPEILEELFRMQEMFKAHGVRVVARVVNDIRSAIHFEKHSRGIGYSAILASSIEEATKLLDKGKEEVKNVQRKNSTPDWLLG